MTGQAGHHLQSADPRRAAWRRAVCGIALAALAFALVLAGCAPTRIGGEGNPLDKTIDDLRDENAALSHKVDSLSRESDLRRRQIGTLEQQLAATRPAIEGVRPGDVPRLVAVTLDSYTSALDTDHDGEDDALRLYVVASDQQGRFIPIAGRVVVQAVVIDAGKTPVELMQKTFAPSALDAAYRSGLTGTHYSLEVPLPRPLPAGVNEVTVKVTLTDAATGAAVTCQQVIKLKRK
jgi:hypothetical protein